MDKVEKVSSWPECGARAQYLYIAGASRDGPLKIGIAERPTKRRTELQTGNPHPLSIYWIYPCPMSALIEPLMHRALAKFRLSGEWFDVPVETAIGALWIIVASEAATDGYSDEITHDWSTHIGLCLECAGVHEPPDSAGLAAWLADPVPGPSAAIKNP